MKPILWGALLLAPFFLFAQQQYNRCGSFDIIRQWEQQYPGTEAALNQVIKNAQNYSLGHDKRDGSRANDTIYRIPVVVHIVYTNAAQNLHDSVVHSQLKVLNDAFRRTGADTANTREVFKPFAGDAGIEFFLADLDPNGNPTTGITRTAGTPPAGMGFSPFNDAMKKTASGGINPWPTDVYLNIWVCDMSSNPLGLILGYAYPPVGNHPHWPAGAAPADTALQGVVIHTPVFGANNPLIATGDPMLRQMNLGKSAVHEVGHFLGLRHIWGESSNPFAPGSCQIDDYISDTPETIDRSQQECDLTKNQCGPACPGLPDYPDMIENYMDYSVDSCNNMFTYGQIKVMRGVLAMYRTRLGQVSLGTIKPRDLSANPNVFVAAQGDSVVITINFTRWDNNTVYPYVVALGDTLESSINGLFVGDSCQQVVLRTGDHLVTPSGDTIVFQVGDTVTSYSDGTLHVTPYNSNVGIGKVNQATFSLYPNPASGMVNVRLAADAKTVTLFNLLGQTMMQQPVSANNMVLDVNHLPAGIYLVQVAGHSGTATQRLVVE